MGAGTPTAAPRGPDDRTAPRGDAPQGRLHLRHRPAHAPGAFGAADASLVRLASALAIERNEKWMERRFAMPEAPQASGAGGSAILESIGSPGVTVGVQQPLLHADIVMNMQLIQFHSHLRKNAPRRVA